MKRYLTYLALMVATALLTPGSADAQVHFGLPSAVKSTVKKLKVKVEEKQKTTFQSYSAKTSLLGIASFSLPSGEIKEIRITDEASQEPLQDITVILTINDIGSDGLYFVIDEQGKYLPGIRNIGGGSASPQNFKPKAIPTIVEGLAQTWNDIWGKKPALLDEIDAPYKNLIVPLINDGSLTYDRTTTLLALAIEMGGGEAADWALKLFFAPITGGTYAAADLLLFKKSEWQMEGNAAFWIAYWLAKGYKLSDKVDIYSPTAGKILDPMVLALKLLGDKLGVPSSKLFRVIVMRNKNEGTYSTYNVNGTIWNASNSQIIEGANIAVNGPSSTQITSDSNGSFAFSMSLPSDEESKEDGSLSINVSKKSFYTSRREIPLKNLTSGQAYIFNAALTPYSSFGGSPNTPSNLQSSVLLPGQINLTWADNSNDENGFEIEKSTNGVAYHSLDAVGSNITSYIDEGLTGNTTYYYRARAYNVYGNSIYSNETSTTTLNNPPTITSLTANPISISTGAVATITCTASDTDGDTLTYSWSAASGTVFGSGAQVTWTAPESSGIYTISCSVSDGKGGVDQLSANVTVTAAGSSADWVLVPGNPSFGTSDFYVMKFEAKNVGGVATSQADVSPWVSINHPSAVAACAALGSSAHLLTIPEVQTINRNIEAQAANWADGVIGSLVSAGGGLKRGNVGITDSASYDGANPEWGIGRNTKAKLVLSNGSELWDWSGNVWERVYGAGADGTLGTPGDVTFTTGGWYEWSVDLNDILNEERPIIGPSNNSWTSGNGIGWYYGGDSTNAVLRGGNWVAADEAGVFAFDAFFAPFYVPTYIGFRCASSTATTGHELPDTGQTQSYTTTFGEDHDYQPAASQPSYTDNGDGTTTDNKTGLMWVKDGNSAGCNNGGTLTWEAALNFCEGLTYAGYSDWRLPNVRELESIVDAGQSYPAINTAYFPNTQSTNAYWTSTTYVPDTGYAWYVLFSNGSMSIVDKAGTSTSIRCVRAGP